MLEGIFATFPDLRFEARHRSVSEDLAIIAWTASATFTCPITRAGCTYSPTGKRLVWNGLDVIPIRDGRVLRKDVYVDSESFERQLAAAAA
jgi:predicted ester cyclase